MSSSTSSTKSDFDYGISIAGLRSLLGERPAIFENDTLALWWKTHWAHVTLPPNYKLNIVETATETDKDVITQYNTWKSHWTRVTLPPNYRLNIVETATETDNYSINQYNYIHTVTGKTTVATTNNLTTPEASNKAPVGSISPCEYMIRSNRSQFIQRTTHFVSHAFTTTFQELIEMLESLEVASAANETAYYYIDVLAKGYHPGTYLENGVDTWLQEINLGLQHMTGGLICCNFKWNKPNHLERAWMLWETYVAIACNKPIALALSLGESQKMADELRKPNGTETILNVVLKLEADPERTKCGFESDKNQLVKDMHRLAKECFPNDNNPNRQMSRTLANATRKAYANAAERIFRNEMSNTQAMATDPDFCARATDLGHQIAVLLNLTGDNERAVSIFEEILPLIPSDVLFSKIPHSIHLQTPPSFVSDDPTELLLFQRHQTIRRRHKVAARDSTVAMLASVLRELNQNDRADNSIRHWLEVELPLSFRGVSLTFLEEFAAKEDVNWLTTNGVIERVVKPMTRSEGKALIDMPSIINPKLIGPKQPKEGPDRLQSGQVQKDESYFFISHAWIQNFHVSNNPWRGGLVQGIVDSTPVHKRDSTYVWFDGFCINQHNTELAFYFDPLRSVINEVDHVKIFLQTWDDPGPLTRVWCLEEIRNAILLGKEVQICMPAAAEKSFRQAVASHRSQVLENLKKVIDRIDIKHACATRYIDKIDVMEKLDNSIGTDAMNLFCKDVFHSALMEAGGLQLTTEEKKQQKEKRELLFADLLDRAQHLSEDKFAQKIEIQRCVAALRLRTYDTGSAAAATPRSRRKGNVNSEKWQEIEDVLEQAERYYGENGKLTKDLKSLLPIATSPKSKREDDEEVDGIAVTEEEETSRKRQKIE